MTETTITFENKELTVHIPNGWRQLRPQDHVRDGDRAFNPKTESFEKALNISGCAVVPLNALLAAQFYCVIREIQPDDLSDPEPRFINHYKHEDCPRIDEDSDVPWPEWSDKSDSMTNDRCPECGAEIEPEETEDNPAYIEPFDPKVIVVRIEGGVVEEVKNIPAGYTVQIRDFDTEGHDDDDESIQEFDGEEAYVTEFESGVE